MNNAFVDWLDAQCRRVAELEARGRTASAAGDAETFRVLMRQKAELLAGLSQEAVPAAAQLPSPAREDALRELKHFSASARQSLSIGSVFYMSALLYRDDHKEGEPNNLEVFLDKLKAGLGQ